MTPTCSIIIPTYNAAPLLNRCLDALFGHPPAIPHEVIVVDDGSTDDTFRVLAEWGEAVRVVHSLENAGFAVACNAGAAASAGGYLVFLNNDTRPRHGWLDALAAYAEANPEAAAVGARLLYPDDTVQHAGVVFCQDGYPRHLYAGFPCGHPAVSRARKLQAVTAACILIRREAFDRVGGFDEAYRNGFEDVDFCLRLGEAGGEIHYCPECVVAHLESVSERRFEHDRDNVRRYRARWAEVVHRDDVEHYLADGLIRFVYDSAYPHAVEVAPELATLDSGSRTDRLEALLASKSRQVSALLREIARLIARVAHLELTPSGTRDAVSETAAEADGRVTAATAGHVDRTPETGSSPSAIESDSPSPATGSDARSPAEGVDPHAESRRHEAIESRLLALEEALVERVAASASDLANASGDVPRFEPGRELRHREDVRRARGLAGSSIPRGASVLVVSHGDPELIAVEGARAAHFPQTEDGAYAGHHPASSLEAISHLEALRERGEGEYLLVPRAARWWFDHYPEFHGHLERHYRAIADEPAGVIYELSR